MKIVVIGGTGLIGSQVVTRLTEHGHEAVPAAPNTGVNSITGEGVKEALAGADVVVDVSNSPSFADQDVLDFFTTSTNTLIAAAKEAGVGHYVALSVVGADELPDSGYLRAKVAQESLIENSGLPYSIVRATQFFEFLARITDEATEGNQVHLPTAYFQPMAAADVAAVVGRTAAGAPLNGRHEVGGPERFRMADLVRGALAAKDDPREVISDPEAQYFGTVLGESSLAATAEDAEIAPTHLADWSAARASAGATPR
ncbi:SDR family oxidoreductase [Occultella gossypii]|uniref:SDR family oxidoreductase n=1 Tax=Occultella gossypii TaxID=2800820 RepID=A0ABS7S3W9_9MICO|nr:SDR family oxidoreductase [Occultella gossypii]MBZ2195044.1 SDR family oxidoreductase [Occultella gossypii]